jgi:hypothetical protein
MNTIDKYHHSIPITAIIFILTLPLVAYFLRQNNLGMVELRNEVIKVDEQTGDLQKIEPALDNLRSYVLTHMNAEMSSPIELPGAYNKAVEAARQKAEMSGKANGNIYRQAQNLCENPNILLSARAQCIQDYILDNAEPGSNVELLEFPPKELYSYSFISPTISFDVAGLSVLLSTSVFIWLIYLTTTQVILDRLSNLISKDPLE